MKGIKKFKLLFVALGLMLVLVACGEKGVENNSNNVISTNSESSTNSKETKTYKSEDLGMEFSYNSNFNDVEDLSQVELLKNEDGTSYDTEGIEKVLKNDNEEVILISSEDSKGSTIEDLKSTIDQIKSLFESVSTDNQLEYVINSNDIIEINGSKMLKTEMTTSNIKTYMLSFIKNNKIISIQYVSENNNYNEENINTVTESLKV